MGMNDDCWADSCCGSGFLSGGLGDKMTARRYTPKELRAMTLRELDSHGREMGLDFTQHHNRAERGRRILAAYADGELRADTSVTSSPLDTAAPGDRKLDFEALLPHTSESAD